MASSDQNESNEMVPQFTCATDVYAFGMTVYEVSDTDIDFTSSLTRRNARYSPALCRTLI